MESLWVLGFVAVVIWFAYLYGKEVAKAEMEKKRAAAAEARRTPEERAATRRKDLRDSLIMDLPMEEKLLFIVRPPANETAKLAKLAELEAQIEKRVEEMMRVSA